MHQPEVLAAIGETKLCEKMQVAKEAPKQEEKPEKQEKPKEQPKPKKEEKPKKKEEVSCPDYIFPTHTLSNNDEF